MKILNVNHIIDPILGGGTGERTVQMSQQLINQGEECTILCLIDSKEKRTLAGGNIVVLPVLWQRFLVPKYFCAGISKLVKEADIVHLMGHWTLLNAMVYVFVRFYKKPYVVCPAGALPLFGRSKIIKKIYNLIVGKRIIRNANKCIAVTEQEKSQFADYGVDPREVIVIPNAIAVPESTELVNNNFVEKFKLPQRPFVLFLGRLNSIKGPDLLVSAFCSIMKNFEDFDLVIAGPDDGMLAELKQLVEKNKATDRVHFVGFVGGIDKYKAYQSATVLAIPSRQEAMSLVVLEAGTVGTPSVFTDQCGLDDFQKNECGWMVPATIEGLTLGLTKALANVEQTKVIGKDVYNYVVERYSWPAIVNIYQKIYRDILNTRGRH